MSDKQQNFHVNGVLEVNKMFRKKSPMKPAYNPATSLSSRLEIFPEIALAAIMSSTDQKKVGEFMNFFLTALERHSGWLNEIVAKHTNFRCALMSGAGPNRFQIQHSLYPADERGDQLELELRGSEDYDKIAVVALLKLKTYEIDRFLRYLFTGFNTSLKEDLLQGQSMGVHFAILRPHAESQYMLFETIALENILKTPALLKKRKREKREKSETSSLLKRKKRIS